MYGQLISSVTVGSGGASSIDFNSIPQTFTDLCLVLSNRGPGDIKITFNGSGTSASRRSLSGSGSSVSSGSGSDGYAGRSTPSGNTANTFSNTMIYIPNYAGSTNKSYSVDSVDEQNGNPAYQVLIAGLWSDTSAITSLSVSDYGGGGQPFVQYSTAYLYGLTKGSGGATVS